MTVFAEVAINAPLRAGDRTFTFSVPASLEALIAVGMPVRVPFGKQTTSGYVVGLSPSADREVRPVDSVDDRLPVLPADLVGLASWMADHYVCSVGEAIDAMLPPRARAPSSRQRLPQTAAAPIDVSGDGQAVIKFLSGASAPRIAIIGDDARFGAYESAIRWALQRSTAVIALEPEVAQAERMAAWIGRKLGVPVARYHSAQPDSTRRTLWQRIASGEFKVVVGTRLAVFAPAAPLGLIIIDHEEDASYKEERMPRYHARTVAETRAKSAQAAIIWGTPAPSLEIVREAEEGRAARLSLPRPDRPSIALVDVRVEAGPLGGLFGRRLYQALAGTLPRGRALLYVPRRGYADFLLCHECGAVTRCARCGVAMTYHAVASRAGAPQSGTPRNPSNFAGTPPTSGASWGGAAPANSWGGKELRCHLCGAHERAPHVCPVCGGTHLRPHGIGTERVEAAARNLFRGTQVLRLDSEVAPDEVSQQKIWQQFLRRGGLLIGTQLLVKGVGQVPAAVVGAIGVDAALHLPDFRAAERTYQVLTRLSALAQREMIVQTFAPTHPALAALASQDPSKFFRDELAARQQFGYPPFVPLINLIVTSPQSQSAGTTARALAESLAQDGEVLGPSPAPLPQIRGRYRWQILIKEREEMRARNRLRDLLRQLELPRTIKIIVDVDPVDLL